MRLFLVLTCLTLSSCGFYRTVFHKGKSTKKRKYFTRGNPEEIFREGALNYGKPLSADYLSELKGFKLTGYSEFVQTTEYVGPKSREEILDENSTDDGSGSRSVPTDNLNYTVRKVGDAVLIEDAVKGSLVLAFNQLDDSLSFAFLRIDGEDHFPELLHVSKNDDGSAYGFIMKYDDPQYNRVVVSLQFHKHSTDEDFLYIPSADQIFDYLFGKGKRTIWSKDIVIDICESNPKDAALLNRHFRDWETTPGMIEDRALVIRRPSPVPPFGDVSYHCAIVADDYIDAENDYSGTLGWAQLHAPTSLLEFGELIIHKGSHKSLIKDEEERQDKLIGTIRHEFGHFIGLGHEFDMDVLNQPLHDSVMGYFGVNDIQRHDRLAVRELYKNTQSAAGVRTIEQLCKAHHEGKTLTPLIAFELRSLKDKSCKRQLIDRFASMDNEVYFYMSETIESLEGIELFPHVTKITFPGEKVKDLTPLEKLPNLTEIDVSGAALKKDQGVICPVDSPNLALRTFCKKLQ